MVLNESLPKSGSFSGKLFNTIKSQKWLGMLTFIIIVIIEYLT